MNRFYHQLVWLIPLIVGILAVANITASNLIATSGQELSRWEAQAQELASTNARLSQAIAQKSSLTYLKSLTSTAGFTSRPVIVYLKTAPSLAQR